MAFSSISHATLAPSSLKRRSLFSIGNSEIDRQQALSDPQVLCAAFTTPGVDFDFVRNPLTFCQAGKSCSFNGADVNEHIVSAIVGLNKAKTLLAVEPFDRTCWHFLLQSISRVTSTRFHSIERRLWEIARRRIQKGTAANRTWETYGFSQ
jgi:hypothetical protein